MTAKLPQALAEYFAATNAHDVAAMIATFAEDSIVKDEGQRHHGLVAIRNWMKETIEKYDFRVDPIESSRTGRKTRVLRLAPREVPRQSDHSLQYAFTVAGREDCAPGDRLMSAPTTVHGRPDGARGQARSRHRRHGRRRCRNRVAS